MAVLRGSHVPLRRTLVGALLLATAGGSACRDDAPPRALAFESIVQDAGAARGDLHELESPSYRIFTEASAWRTYWQNLDHAPIPPVDFEAEMVLCVYLGAKPTGGYAIEVSAVTLQGDEVRVRLERTEPAPGAMLTQALTSPYAIYRIARPEGAAERDLRFSFEDAERTSAEPVRMQRLPQENTAP